MTTNCDKIQEVVAFLQDQLGACERARMAEHIRACPECSAMLKDCEKLLQDLEAWPAESAREDMSARVLKEVQARSAAVRRRLRAVAAVAASLLVCAALVVLEWPRKAENPNVLRTPSGKEADVRDAALAKALEWLALNQKTNGGWPVERLGGDDKYKIALSALAVTALSSCARELRNRYLANIKNGTDYLLRRQKPDGRFACERSDSLYNHCIATLCLLELLGTYPEERLKLPVSCALACICRTQTSEGGWNYTGLQGESPNSGVSIWALQALLWGESLGFEGLKPSLERGFQWLAALIDDAGRLGYSARGDFPYGTETLSAMAAFCRGYGGSKYLDAHALDAKVVREPAGNHDAAGEIDYYQSYFIAYLEHPTLQEWRDDFLAALATEQQKADSCEGSWDPADRWGATGGRVYATALATLILESDIRASQLRQWTR